VACDSTNEMGLRRYAILQIGKAKSWKNQDIDTQSKLKSLMDDPAAPDEVKAAAITAMRRTNSPNLKGALNAILHSPDAYSDIEIRHTSVSAAKSKVGGNFVPQLRSIALSNRSDDVIGSAIYALGIIGDVGAMVAVADIYKKQGKTRTIRSAFGKNAKTILLMLNPSNDQSVIDAGIVAAQIGRLPAAIKALKVINIEHADVLLREHAERALRSLDGVVPRRSQDKLEDR